MELEFELDDYMDLEHGEYGATLVVDATKVIEETCAHNRMGYLESYSSDGFEIQGATLFTYDQDGGNRRELELDESEVLQYVTEDEIMERLQNEN